MSQLRYNLTSATPQIASWSAAILAQTAYESSPRDRRSVLREWGYREVEPIDGAAGVQAIVGHSPDHTVIAFAGTNDRDDLRADLNFRRTSFLDAGGVHTGALRQFEQVYPSVGARGLIGKRVYLVGHSLGAMLAGITAAQLLRLNVVVSGVHLFGCPRFGDGQFASWYDQQMHHRTWRYVRVADVVTRIPPAAPTWAMKTIQGLRLVRIAKWLGGYPAVYQVGDYRHVGRVVYFDSEDRVIRDAGIAHIAWDRVLGRFARPVRGIGDHSMSEYVRILRTYAMRAVRTGGV